MSRRCRVKDFIEPLQKYRQEIFLFKRTGLFTRFSRFRGGIARRGGHWIPTRGSNESDAEK